MDDSESTSSDIEAAINDILNDSDTFSDTSIKESPKPLRIAPSPQPRFQSKSSLNRAPMSPVKKIVPRKSNKCVIPYIGGPDLEPGITTDITDPKFCSNLICVSCDHKVIRFPNYKWSPSTDYLFLRNNYPLTVQKNLIPAPGNCAYCCQCTSCDETCTRQLSGFNSTWVCRGHY